MARLFKAIPEFDTERKPSFTLFTPDIFVSVGELVPDDGAPGTAFLKELLFAKDEDTTLPGVRSTYT